MQLVDSVPKYSTKDQHKTLVESTPTSFTDIPPVLKHKEDNVAVLLDPPLNGFSNEDSKTGTLYILESVLVFMSATGRGFQVEYPHITLHAISRADSKAPSIYCQLYDPMGNMEVDEGKEVKEDEDEDPLLELSIIPKTADSLEPIFEALSICAALHPDELPADSDSDDDAFVDPDISAKFEVFDGTEEQELSEVGKAALAHMESIIYNPFEERTADAEEEEEKPEEENLEPGAKVTEKEKA